MKKCLLSFSLLLSTLIAYTQSHNDYLGAGHQTGITVTTSHSQTSSNNGFYTIDGFPIMEKAPLSDAGRLIMKPFKKSLRWAMNLG